MEKLIKNKKQLKEVLLSHGYLKGDSKTFNWSNDESLGPMLDYTNLIHVINEDMEAYNRFIAENSNSASTASNLADKLISDLASLFPNGEAEWDCLAYKKEDEDSDDPHVLEKGYTYNGTNVVWELSSAINNLLSIYYIGNFPEKVKKFGSEFSIDIEPRDNHMMTYIRVKVPDYAHPFEYHDSNYPSVDDIINQIKDYDYSVQQKEKKKKEKEENNKFTSPIFYIENNRRKYANTPFLWALYDSLGLKESKCVLNRTLKGYQISDNIKFYVEDNVLFIDLNKEQLKTINVLKNKTYEVNGIVFSSNVFYYKKDRYELDVENYSITSIDKENSSLVQLAINMKLNNSYEYISEEIENIEKDICVEQNYIYLEDILDPKKRDSKRKHEIEVMCKCYFKISGKFTRNGGDLKNNFNLDFSDKKSEIDYYSHYNEKFLDCYLEVKK